MLINQDSSVDRTKYIGGSDIGAILGLSPYKSPLEVWLEKTGKKINQADSLPLRFGSFAEEFVAREYSRATGFELVHDESIYIHPEHFFMSAHIDRFILGGGGDQPPTKILECKTANSFSTGNWGEAGTDQVPMSYLCQCIWYMAVTQIRQADLAVLFGNSDFRIYHITHDQALENLVIEKAITFWEGYVLKDIAPPVSSQSDCHLLFQKGDPQKTVNATSENLKLAKRLHLLNEEMATREDEIASIKQVFMNAMGDAESLLYQDQVLATWKAPKPSYRLDSKRLELEHPQLVTQYQVPIQNSRRLMIKHLSMGEYE
jgi:putative phage-type endonuclease